MNEKYLRGEKDLDRERADLRIGERERLRPIGDLLGGLRARLGGGDLEKKQNHFLKGKYVQSTKKCKVIIERNNLPASRRRRR